MISELRWLSLWFGNADGHARWLITRAGLLTITVRLEFLDFQQATHVENDPRECCADIASGVIALQGPRKTDTQSRHYRATATR